MAEGEGLQEELDVVLLMNADLQDDVEKKEAQIKELNEKLEQLKAGSAEKESKSTTAVTTKAFNAETKTEPATQVTFTLTTAKRAQNRRLNSDLAQHAKKFRMTDMRPLRESLDGGHLYVYPCPPEERQRRRLNTKKTSKRRPFSARPASKIVEGR